MNELELYRQHKPGWVFYLMHKYLRESRFKPVIAAMKEAANDEEKLAARQALEDFKNG